MNVWECKSGYAEGYELPVGSDLPMRKAIQQAFFDLTGQWPNFTSSGWGAELTEAEREVVEGKEVTP